ncbi:hypothetical protein M378DRAFT_163769 [Amanita muscaria Koide BX008]|uniref:Zn(2)-C6 fungal-type domain-containing protein n=1 Tax=Amanita muscaria (strain Koide BX008) TaxID=946122 RepID=A0A0C2WQX9_AMAMK|nr:hypothetical protein M378DRAFT_163769 [Amanita muscaria Koide BX008]
MSSNEEDNDLDFGPDAVAQGAKKRRIQRACDMCRRKKIRCDGAQMADNRCTNCTAYDLLCTYVEAAKKRGPPKGYVESLENRVQKLEGLLHKLCPDKDVLKELNSSFDLSEPLSSPGTSAGSPAIKLLQEPRDLATSALRRAGEVAPKDEPDDERIHLKLDEKFERLHIDPNEYRFFGKSSGVMLIQTAVELKNEYTGQDESQKPTICPQRPEYWAIKPWEQSAAISQEPNYKFPPDDLAKNLIDLYFQHFNLILPLLHRPTFDRLMAEGLHYRDLMFGGVVLLVCALGSRYSDDPRVILDGENDFHSCGWKWFEQVQMVRPKLLVAPSYMELQIHCLAVQYLQGTSAPQACWTLVGVGIRLAQDVGLHRRKIGTKPWTTEDELRKRVFWVLVAMDIQMGCALGRPCAIQNEDYDIDYPLEVDDEYWEHPDPEQRFKQPPGKPSYVTAFNVYLKLNQLLGFTLRTIYSINKSKMLMGFIGQQWEQHIVAELDSALNKWVDSVPDHLRWDPNREDENFFKQSVVLYTNYYHLQIMIHRPFIPSPRKPSPLSFPSLAICTNAARSCSHLLDVMRRRGQDNAAFVHMAAFTSGIVLLLNIWGGKRSGLSADPQKEMADVYKCMSVLRGHEERWYTAGRLWDILYELTCAGDLPLPQPSPPATNKRVRDHDTPTVERDTPTPKPIAADTRAQPRVVVGSKRVSHALRQSSTGLPQQQQPEQNQLYELPVYSKELGRLPLHGQVHFATQPSSAANVQQMQNQPAGQANYWWLSQEAQIPQQQVQAPLNPVVDPLWDGGSTSGFTYRGSLSAAMDTPKDQQPRNIFTAQMPDRSLPTSTAGMFAGGDGIHNYMETNVQTMQAAAAQQQSMIDNDMVAMWLNAPSGFEFDDWGTYLTTASELNHGMQAAIG